MGREEPSVTAQSGSDATEPEAPGVDAPLEELPGTATGHEVGDGAPMKRPPRSEQPDVLKQRLELALAKLAETEANVFALKAERDTAVAPREAALEEAAGIRTRAERERDEAVALRVTAMRERDEALAAKQQALSDRREALDERKGAVRERDAAKAERDRALVAADKARIAQQEALAERDRALAERDLACAERDGVVSAFERGLPVRPPQPRYGPERPVALTPMDLWMPRLVALLIVVVFAIVVLRLFSG